MGTAVGAASKQEKYPKEGKEDPKSEQKEKVRYCWVSVVVSVGLVLLPVV